MKKLKKIMALLLAMVMVLGMTTTVMAKSATNATEAKITGVESGLTVTAYQIIKYNDSGAYEEVLTGTISKNKGNLTPTASDIVALEARKDELQTSVEFTESKDDKNVVYTNSNLAEGTWMILVTGSEKYIYNPAIISVMMGTDGNKVYGELDFASDKWNETPELFMKRNEPTIKKTAVTPEVQGVQYGDIIQFQIVTDIPSYTANKTNIEYTITDTLKGLKLVVDNDHPVTAKVGKGETWVEDSVLTEAVTEGVQNDAVKFVVNLSKRDDFIKKYGNQQIKLTYYAEVTSEAKLTVDELNNTAELDYSTYDKTGHKEDDTKHYTFGIDTSITGKEGDKNTSGEFIKINDKGDVAYNQETEEIEFKDGAVPLEGAQFKLVYGEDKNIEFTDANGNNRFTTDKTGRLAIHGLDSGVEYWLIETKAPAGYTLNETPVPVIIEAEYDDNTGELVSYNVKIDNEVTFGYTWKDGVATIKPGVGNPHGFKNTNLTQLPSTGGIGTTIFTVAGCAIMIGAVALFFASRKKQSK